VTEDSQFYITNRLNSLFLRAENEAKAFNDEYISTEHLFLASIQDSELSRIYQRYGINYDKAAAVIQKIRGGKKLWIETQKISTKYWKIWKRPCETCKGGET